MFQCVTVRAYMYDCVCVCGCGHQCMIVCISVNEVVRVSVFDCVCLYVFVRDSLYDYVFAFVQL